MKNLASKIYDKMLLAYAHLDILVNQVLDSLDEKKGKNG